MTGNSVIVIDKKTKEMVLKVLVCIAIVLFFLIVIKALTMEADYNLLAAKYNDCSIAISKCVCPR